MDMASDILFVIRTVVLLVYFLLFGAEVMAGIILLSWILFARRAQIRHWVFAKRKPWRRSSATWAPGRMS